jgi:hypothetical protein
VRHPTSVGNLPNLAKFAATRAALGFGALALTTTWKNRATGSSTKFSLLKAGGDGSGGDYTAPAIVGLPGSDDGFGGTRAHRASVSPGLIDEYRHFYGLFSARNRSTTRVGVR